MYAVIKTGGKQYRVSPGDVIYIEKLAAAEGEEVAFDVLMVSRDDDVLVGTPIVEGVQAKGKVLLHGRGKKTVVYKFKAKKNYRRKQGHRQPFTKVEITEIAGA
ncbi:MAG: 50S ribosomal protein L21 [Christensenellales bacterium]|jgi:large subunit ribosomal protein L21